MDFHEPSTHPNELPGDCVVVVGYDHARMEYRTLGFVSGDGTLRDALDVVVRDSHDGMTVAATKFGGQSRKTMRVTVNRRVDTSLEDA